VATARAAHHRQTQLAREALTAFASFRAAITSGEAGYNADVWAENIHGLLTALVASLEAEV
jgi:hypothetical protein